MDIQNDKSIRGLLAICILASAVVGSVFGYYGGLLSSSSDAGVVNPTGVTRNIFSNDSESAKVIDIVKKYSPAVVSIVATKDLPVIEQYNANPFGSFCNDPFFSQFFGGCDYQVPQYRQNGTQKQEVGAGTGFVVAENGLILTNRHVVDVQGAEYTVIMSDGRKYPAKVLARDPIQDLAVMKVEAVGLATVKIGNSDKLQVGETVIAIGNALGQFSNSVSKGVVSGLSRSVTASSGNSSEKLDKVIQTDAAINPGNSGGPLINLNGEVIGINTAIVSGAQNLGFAVPINMAIKDIKDVQSTGKISYPYLGVRYVMVNAEIKNKNNLSVDYGALVARGQTVSDLAVIPGSPASKAGVRENDVILEIDGKKINAENTLAEIIQNKKVGDRVGLKILRDNNQISLTVVLEENPAIK